MNTNKTFADRLQSALDYRNKKQIDLTNGAGLNKSLISQYLSGKFDAKNDKIDIIAEYLDINPLFLMGKIDDFGTYDTSDSLYGDHNANLAYFADKPDLLEIYKEIHESDNLKLLFDSAKDLEPKDLEFVLKIIKNIKEENN